MWKPLKTTWDIIFDGFIVWAWTRIHFFYQYVAFFHCFTPLSECSVCNFYHLRTFIVFRLQMLVFFTRAQLHTFFEWRTHYLYILLSHKKFVLWTSFCLPPLITTTVQSLNPKTPSLFRSFNFVVLCFFLFLATTPLFSTCVFSSSLFSSICCEKLETLWGLRWFLVLSDKDNESLLLLFHHPVGRTFVDKITWRNKNISSMKPSRSQTHTVVAGLCY